MPSGFPETASRIACAAITVKCYPHVMPEERPDAGSAIDDYVAKLKSKIPPMEHGAVDSRLEGLLNDPSADEDDVILILGQEFDPDHQG